MTERERSEDSFDQEIKVATTSKKRRSMDSRWTAELNRSRTGSTGQNGSAEEVKRVLDLLQLIDSKMDADS